MTRIEPMDSGTLAIEDLTISSDLTVGGDLTVSGSASISVDETVTGDLGVTGDISTDDITIGGNAIFTAGGSITSTSNGNLTIVPNGLGITQIGDAGSTSHTLNANDDLFVSGKLEVDGMSYFDGALTSLGTASMVDATVTQSFTATNGTATSDYAALSYNSLSFSGDGGVQSKAGSLNMQAATGSQIVFNSDTVIAPDKYLYIGMNTGSRMMLDYSTNQTSPTVLAQLPRNSKNIIFSDANFGTFDYGHSASTTPTLFVHSAGSTTNQWVSTTHDGTDAIMNTGTGLLKVGTGTANRISGVPGSFFVSGPCEFNDTTHFDSISIHYNGMRINNDVGAVFGTSSNSNIRWSTVQATSNTVIWGLGNTSKSIIFTTGTNIFRDHDHSAASHPTIFIHSSTDPDSSNIEYSSLGYNQLSFNLGGSITTASNKSIYISPNGTGQIYLSGGQVVARRGLNTSGSAQLGDYIVGVFDTSSPRTITLAATANIAGKVFCIKDESGGAASNNITIQPAVGNINGAGTYTINANYNSVSLYCDGANWFTY